MQTMTRDLDGAALDLAVAMAQGRKEIKIFAPSRPSDRGRIEVRYNPEPRASTARFNPTEDWQIAGPIIERERLQITTHGDDWVVSSPNPVEIDGCRRYVFASGSTALVAAMRCFVETKLGDEVDIPDSLVKRNAPRSSGPSM